MSRTTMIRSIARRTHGLLLLAAIVDRVPEKAGVFVLFGLLIVQSMLVHVGQWWGLWIIAAFHPVKRHRPDLRDVLAGEAIHRLLNGAGHARGVTMGPVATA